MILRITDVPSSNTNEYVISLSNFGDRAYHPFIITNTWDEVHIDLCDETPRGIIRQLVPTYKVVPHFDKENVTPKVMQLLCEVIPDHSAKIRQVYIKDRAHFNDLLNEIGV